MAHESSGKGTTVPRAARRPGARNRARLARPAVEQLEDRCLLTLLYAVTASPYSLIQFDSAAPGTILSSKRITGLGIDTGLAQVSQIAFRPATGQLYAAVRNTTGAILTDGLAVIDVNTGRAFGVGVFNSFNLGVGHGGFVPPLPGIQFDPALDQVYTFYAGPIVGLQRVSPRDASHIGSATPLNYAPGDPNANKIGGIGGLASTSTAPGGTVGKLYAIDVFTGVLALVDPVDTGTLHTVGPLGVTNDQLRAGFDIITDAGTTTAYAASSTQLYTSR